MTAVAELALTESRTLRTQYADRTDVLDKVKTLAMAGDTGYAFTAHVADYFDVTEEAIDQIVKRNRAELEENGYEAVTRAKLEGVTSDTLNLSPKARRVAVFRRRTVLNLAMLMDGNDVARQVRTYLLDVEEAATPEQKLDALAARTATQLEALGVAKKYGLVNDSYLEGVSRTLLARMTGEEPQLDPADITITCHEYLAEKGLKGADLRSARVKLGKAVAALYRARYGTEPQEIPRLVEGIHIGVKVYTRRDIDLFDTAWAEVSRHYTPAVTR
ncbi:hypothetical protein [Nocardiopsis trehalosi]|jgi:hypothetical protein|uniref:hypothetical protein n=1 Tax=Nocardiopsis trehalosi TaxID=109329 RepID=UPI0008318CA8|nr:hypothetical protein [Nocardiopsis trehalosi]